MITIRATSDFNFWATVTSHGWCDLPPFSVDTVKKEARRVLELSCGTIVACTMRADGGRIGIRTSGAMLTPVQRREVLSQVRSCLRMDESLTLFHVRARRHARFRWIATRNAGRLLRAPTVFEDIVKMICTTNCTWALTTIMVTNLVRLMGRRGEEGIQAFPSPADIAGTTERFLRTRVKAGYRAPFLLEFARTVAEKRIDVESWRETAMPSVELFNQVRTIKGVGPYAAGNILKLLGRYDYLGLDSWVRAQYFNVHRNGRSVADKTIERHYKEYGEWRGLFFWLEMTKEWRSAKRVEGKEAGKGGESIVL